MNTLTAIDDNNSRVSIDLKLPLSDSKKAVEFLFRGLGNSVTVSEQEMLDFVVRKTKEFWVLKITTQEQEDLLSASETVANQAKQEFINNTTTISSKIKI
jgi:hypothetical protein